MTCVDKRCLKHDLDITVDTWKYLFYFKLSENIFVPWVYVKIKQCALDDSDIRGHLQRTFAHEGGSHKEDIVKNTI